MIGAAAALAACGDPTAPVLPDTPVAPADAMVDTPPRGPCWLDIAKIPRGSAVLGTGRDGYQPMPDEPRLEYGTQDGFMLIASVRMTGFAPGIPWPGADVNLRTRIQVYFDETNIPLNEAAKCAFQFGYIPFGNEFELIEEAPLIFDTCWRSEHLFGKKLRVELEVLDKDGGYATDVKVVTAREPDGVYPVDMGTPGCPTLPVEPLSAP